VRTSWEENAVMDYRLKEFRLVLASVSMCIFTVFEEQQVSILKSSPV
jgi:hypothetical protein